MNTQYNPLLAPLRHLDRRVRWKRWLGKAHRLVWLLAGIFVGMFLADYAIGFRTFTLRTCLGALALTAGALLILDAMTCWLARLDLLALAQIIEKRYPALAERLLTLVQMDAAAAHPDLAAVLQRETAQHLETVDVRAACPLQREKRAWLMTLPILGIAVLGLCFAPAFREFSGRFFASWTTPLTPYRIIIDQPHGYALRGGSYEITGTIERVDPYAPDAAECALSKDDESATEVAATALRGGRFVFRLDKLVHPLRLRVVAGETRSDVIEMELINAPKLARVPKVTVAPPAYLAKEDARAFELTANGPPAAILQYSRLAFTFDLDQSCRGTLVLVSGEQGSEVFVVALRAGEGANQCVAELAADTTGPVRAELRLDLPHALAATIPLGSWHVYADRPPRFTQALRLVGASGNLQAGKQYRIAPGDVVRLETGVADEEGLSALDVEFRLNDQPPKMTPWINAAGQRQLTINERLPLPSGLKAGDRVQFRVRARDNRTLPRGASNAAPPLPPIDLEPQSVYAPDAAAADAGWIQLYVDPSIDSFQKEQVAAQGEEIRSAIDSIQKKIRSEASQVETMKRGIHLQAALTLDQRLQTEKLQTLNREIIEDLARAGQHFLLNPELARLAEHFLDIAESEMAQAGGDLARFGAKDRPLSQGEKDLQAAHDALLRALKKLERMNDWNKLLAQARLDQAQLDKLAQRQQDLADRLEALRGQEGLSDADLAKQIEAIRQEQARIAQQTEQLKDENQLVRESLAALERQRVAKLAQDAERLAAEQQALRALAPEKMSPELKARLQQLVKRQAELGKRIQGKPALEAADLLKKPSLDRAIARQKEQEKQLQSARTNLLPGGVANAVRAQIVRLAKEQNGIRSDLERVGQQIGQFNETMLKARLKELVARQRDLRAAVAKLPIDAGQTAEHAGQQLAEQLARQAADFLAAKDALGSYDTMEKAQRELERLAGLLPPNLTKDRKDITDPMVLAKLEQVEQFADRQKEIRKDTEQLLADWLKASANKKADAKMEQLAKELLELAQKGTSPDAKALAKESAAALERAKKAMEAGMTAKAKGESSATQDAEAAKQLDAAVKALQKFAQDQAKKSMSKANLEKTAAALKAGAEQMKLAQSKLPGMTKDAQAAMQAAADQLAQAANQANRQGAKNLPKAGRKPAAKAGPTPASGNAQLPGNLKLETFQGKAWGELPGELKTRMMQDFRTRYGDEYAEVIQQYFERLAETPMPAPKK